MVILFVCVCVCVRRSTALQTSVLQALVHQTRSAGSILISGVLGCIFLFWGLARQLRQTWCCGAGASRGFESVC